jgi:hypothetical protein
MVHQIQITDWLDCWYLHYIIFCISELKKNDALVVSLSVLGSSIERENILNDKALHLVFGAFLQALST